MAFDIFSIADVHYLDRDNIDAVVERHIEHLLDAHPGANENLVDDPFGEIDSWPELSVVVADRTPPRGNRCQIDARYDHGNRTITIYTSTYGRDCFSLLHELGNYLQLSDRDWVKRLALMRTRADVVQERISNAFAARIMFSPDLVANALANAGPHREAEAVFAIWQAVPSASRSASCEAVLRRLNGEVAVVLVDRNFEVIYSNSSGELYSPPRGVRQDWEDLAREAWEHPGKGLIIRQASLCYRNEWTRQGLEGSIATDITGEYICAVLRPSPDEKSPTLFQAGGFCEFCADEFDVSTSSQCDKCREYRCTRCHRCACHLTIQPAECTRCHVRLSNREAATGRGLCDFHDE